MVEMNKTYRLTESELTAIVAESVRRVLNERNSVNEELTRAQVRDELEDGYKSKEFEKAVHNIVVDVMNNMLTNIWNKKALLQSFLRKK